MLAMLRRAEARMARGSPVRPRIGEQGHAAMDMDAVRSDDERVSCR